jgi:hypothetical protein
MTYLELRGKNRKYHSVEIDLITPKILQKVKCLTLRSEKFLCSNWWAQRRLLYILSKYLGKLFKII